MNVLDFGMDLPAAPGAARFHHPWSPDELKNEEGTGANDPRVPGLAERL
jgi:gamma-glutamyltranspeptidase